MVRSYLSRVRSLERGFEGSYVTLHHLIIENDLKILRYDFVVDIQDGMHTSKK
jgi:hypothetical protein